MCFVSWATAICLNVVRGFVIVGDFNVNVEQSILRGICKQ